MTKKDEAPEPKLVLGVGATGDIDHPGKGAPEGVVVEDFAPVTEHKGKEKDDK